MPEVRKKLNAKVKTAESSSTQGKSGTDKQKTEDRIGTDGQETKGEWRKPQEYEEETKIGARRRAEK